MLELIERFEFQLRGAIHSHCLLWTEKPIPQLIRENYIRADIPDPTKEPRLHELVMKYQIHRCRTNICGGPGINGKCSKGFPCDVSDTTHHEPGKSRYTYARGENDLWVSPELLLIWEGHCNVQYVTNEALAAYITKYVPKGEPLSTLVNNGEGTTALQRHILARRIGSMEFMVLATGREIFRSTCGTFYSCLLPSQKYRTTLLARLIISRRTQTILIIQMPLKSTLRDLKYMKTTHTSNISDIAKSRKNE
jgi:hypothetical protein